MGQRLELQALLEELMGNREVKFQPDENIHLEYPCIVYKRDNERTIFANDKPYTTTQRYAVTYISRDPDDPMKDKIRALPLCTFNRNFIADSLYHDIYTLYY